jgi:hypothetical protein
MGLGDLHQNDIDAGLGAMALRPLDVQKDERSAWGAPWRALKAAGAEVMGSTADVLKGYGQVMAGTDAPLGSPEHQKLQQGVDLSSQTGDSLRGYARSQRPDPMTASTAEQVVFGVTRPLAKLLAGGALLGPFGLAGAAAEEGFTQADDLKQQGVDVGTRTAVGALTAAATFGSAALPLAGSTLGRTVALYLAGGPGGFMAQQAGTRAILEHADYAGIAQQFDPLDPMGLALSALIPLPFAAHGALRVMRGRAAEAPPARIEPTMDAPPHDAALAEPPAFSDTQPAVHVPQEVVDAAMVHNLTRLADAHEAVAADMPAIRAEIDAAIRATEPAEPPAAPAPQTADAEPGAPRAVEGEGNPLDAATLTRTEPDAVKDRTPEHVASVTERAAQIEAERPDTVVRHDEAGKPVTAAEEMARIRQEIAEGTDLDLGTLDADLVRVAAACALSTGA